MFTFCRILESMKISVINLHMELICATITEGLIDKVRYIQCQLL
jgi:hypothetical protein